MKLIQFSEPVIAFMRKVCDCSQQTKHRNRLRKLWQSKSVDTQVQRVSPLYGLL